MVEIIILVYMLVLLAPYIFIFCEPSQWYINQFEGFEEEVTRCDWYSLPIDLQRIYMIFLTDAQNPIFLSSFGDIECNRDTSKRVLEP